MLVCQVQHVKDSRDFIHRAYNNLGQMSYVRRPRPTLPDKEDVYWWLRELQRSTLAAVYATHGDLPLSLALRLRDVLLISLFSGQHVPPMRLMSLLMLVYVPAGATPPPCVNPDCELRNAPAQHHAMAHQNRCCGNIVRELDTLYGSDDCSSDSISDTSGEDDDFEDAEEGSQYMDSDEETTQLGVAQLAGRAASSHLATTTALSAGARNDVTSLFAAATAQAAGAHAAAAHHTQPQPQPQPQPPQLAKQRWRHLLHSKGKRVKQVCLPHHKTSHLKGEVIRFNLSGTTSALWDLYNERGKKRVEASAKPSSRRPPQFFQTHTARAMDGNALCTMFTDMQGATDAPWDVLTPRMMRHVHVSHLVKGLRELDCESDIEDDARIMGNSAREWVRSYAPNDVADSVSHAAGRIRRWRKHMRKQPVPIYGGSDDGDDQEEDDV